MTKALQPAGYLVGSNGKGTSATYCSWLNTSWGGVWLFSMEICPLKDLV